jgi:beta propeller repeat protein
MYRFLKVMGSLAGLAAIGILLAALALTFGGQFGARGQPQVAQQPYPPPQTPTPGPYPPPGTPAPTFTPFPTVTPGGIPPTPPPTPSPIEIVLTPVPPEVTDALTQPIQITTRPAPRSELAVDGNYVVWRSYEDNQTNIAAYNLATSEERRISSLPGGKSGLTVSGRYVVWAESMDLGDRHVTVLRAYDLVGQQEIQIGPDEQPGDYPDVSGHTVVWSDWRHYNNDREVDLYGYDLQRGEEFPVVVRPGIHLFPRVDGNWAIYLYWPPGASLGGRFPSQPTLRVHHLRTGEDIALGPAYYRNDASCCRSHTISGQRVVWLGSNGQLHLYDLATRQERILPEPQRFDPSLALHGNMLHTGSRVYNVETGAMLTLFQSFRLERPSQVDEVATDGQTVAWIFDAGGEGRVYVARFRRLP